MTNNTNNGCGCIGGIISLMIPAYIIYYFGIKKSLMFIIDSILLMMIAPAIIGLIYFILSKNKD